MFFYFGDCWTLFYEGEKIIDGVQIKWPENSTRNFQFARRFPRRHGPPFVGLSKIHNPSSYFTDLNDLELDILRQTEETRNICFYITPKRESNEDAATEVAARDRDERSRLGNTDWYTVFTFVASIVRVI